MICVLFDIETGKKSLYEGGDLFWWSEGNGSCDCNRALAFENVEEELDKKYGKDTCYGSHRIIAIDIIGNYSNKTEMLKLINQDYTN